MLSFNLIDFFANILILSLTILIPLSSDAFSSIILSDQYSDPNICLANAIIVEVLPQPEGP